MWCVGMRIRLWSEEIQRGTNAQTRINRLPHERKL